MAGNETQKVIFNCTRKLRITFFKLISIFIVPCATLLLYLSQFHSTVQLELFNEILNERHVVTYQKIIGLLIELRNN